MFRNNGYIRISQSLFFASINDGGALKAFTEVQNRGEI